MAKGIPNNFVSLHRQPVENELVVNVIGNVGFVLHVIPPVNAQVLWTDGWVSLVNLSWIAPFWSEGA